MKAAISPSAHGPDYGYLWWLNTQGKNYPGLPANAYGARGAGSNTITISARPGPGRGVALARRQRGRVREAGRRCDQGAEHRPLTPDIAAELERELEGRERTDGAWPVA